jgi:hypothetical protein
VCKITEIPERTYTHLVPDPPNTVENEDFEYVSALVV